jgi:transcriptional regulator GlxA family with amidase domain
MEKKRNIAIMLFDDVEVLDFAGPFEVFSVTSEINEEHPFNVYTVAEMIGKIRARNGLSVNPDFTLSECPTPDIIVVPGGQGTRVEMKNPAVIAWVTELAERVEYVLSVCTGALILGKAGLLDGLTATTHHQAIELLGEIAPKTTVVEDERFVDNGKVITAGGISAGIDMSLYVVGKLLGEEKAKKTARYMEYGDWRGKA